MTRFRVALLLLAAVAIGRAPVATAEPETREGAAPPVPVSRPLTIDEVVASVERAHPMLIAALLEREQAAGALLAARGAFDLNLRAEGEGAPSGFYDRYTAGLGIDQPTRLWGSRFYGGYRIGRGDFPSYLGGDKTNEGGELRAGVEVPLLRDGYTDARRTRLLRSELKLRATEPRIEVRRIGLVREASEAFWSWVAMGLNVGVKHRLLAAAEARQQQLAGRAKQGAIPRIQLADNERLIVDRRIRLRGAERDAQESALTLSLFLRDEAGDTVTPSNDRLPTDFPPENLWGEDQLRANVAAAHERHPLVQELALRRAELETGLRLETNAQLPDLRFRVEGSRDMGESTGGLSSKGIFSDDAKDETEVKAGLRLELPVQRRGARGRAAGLRSQIARLDQETRFTRDQIEAEIRIAMAALTAAFDQTSLARENLALARQLEQAEVRRLSLGSSDLIDVNIREVQAADAERALIFAQAAYFRALARYEAARAAPGDSGSTGTASHASPRDP